MIYIYLVLCNILFSPVILGSDTAESKLKVTNNTKLDSLPSNESQVPSEGGAISPDKLAMALPKNYGNIPNLDSEIGKSKIVARKGAFNYTDDVTKSPEKPLPAMNENTSSKPSKSVETPKQQTTQQQDQSKTTTKTMSLPKDLPKNDTIVLNTTSGTTSKPVHKPLILNADVLENTPPEVKSSPGPVIHSQIQSPNNDVKTYISNANSNPGMVMPIVITILLVPMFAVLGYMALRRGQEAWKNRHYKRMDFLLDGMYND